ncbi:MAG: RluA family pseudouridine synthase [Pseudomonadota bacterium]
MSDPTTAAPQVAATRTAVRTLVIGPEDAGQRLDRLLGRLLASVPRSHVFRLLRKGEVRLNGKRVKGDARVAEGDSLRLPPIREEVRDPDAPRPVPRRLIEQVEAAIVHEDARLLVLDKPSGIAVHGGSGISFGVIEALRASRPEETLELVHRLDRDTSGCLLVARRRSTLRSLHALMREEAFDKRYLALLRGKWEYGQKLIDAPLRTDLRVGGERTVKVAAGGKAAASEFRVIQFYGKLATLVEVRLLTGRTHQIRVHATHAGHPVAGDAKYGDAQFNEQMQELGLKRLFLHAHSISYEDPERQVTVSVSAPLPEDLKAGLDQLAAAAARKVRARGGVKADPGRRDAKPRRAR